MVETDHPGLSIVRQCELQTISRSSFYYTAKGETETNLELMRLIDAQFLETPWYGARSSCQARHPVAFPPLVRDDRGAAD